MPGQYVCPAFASLARLVGRTDLSHNNPSDVTTLRGLVTLLKNDLLARADMADTDEMLEIQACVSSIRTLERRAGL